MYSQSASMRNSYIAYSMSFILCCSFLFSSLTYTYDINSLTTTLQDTNTASSSSICVFCTDTFIKRQEIYRGTYLRICLDSSPIQPGHILIIPIRHIRIIEEMSPEESMELVTMTKVVSQYFMQFYNTDEYIVLQKNGKSAGQSIPHVHFHVIPMKDIHWIKKMAAQMTVLYKIFFGSQPLDENRLTEEVIQARLFFSLGTAPAKE